MCRLDRRRRSWIVANAAGKVDHSTQRDAHAAALSRISAPASPPLVPMPFVPADEDLPSLRELTAAAAAPSTPMPMWPSYAPSVASMSTTLSPAAYSSCSPTLTLTISPSTTDSSADSIFDERTIQMPTIVDAPSLTPMKMDATCAYTGELPSSAGGLLSDGGISAGSRLHGMAYGSRTAGTFSVPRTDS